MKLKARTTNDGQSRVLLIPENMIPQVHLNPAADQLGKYIGYCHFRFHQGVVTQGQNVCEMRNCRWYEKIYLEHKEDRKP